MCAKIISTVLSRPLEKQTQKWF